MKLIVGLGNPGKQYSNTRHNAGFIVIDELLKNYDLVKNEANKNYELFFVNINKEKVLFLKPLKFMNLSGEVLQEIISYYKINYNDILIIHDDKDLQVGQIRLKESGNHAGHNGVKNIFLNLSTDKILRWRIGVGTPPKEIKIIDWVLMRLTNEEIEVIKNLVKNNLSLINDFVSGFSFKDLSNKYN